MNLGNTVISLVILVFGGYLMYHIYKKPSPMSNTNFKGIIGSLGFIYLGFMGLINKIDIIQIFKDIFNIK